ncbi:arginine--tRNA ligase, chloroplastic/mitochondrial [Tanacetum coccineum]|uniref:Arginine--tRNA ligase, chloroplastic/mitochondrial n=1 Tax=Tanacetum coccineum TaxID=301880 RepID=A0ABQ5CE34_9ASTR
MIRKEDGLVVVGLSRIHCLILSMIVRVVTNSERALGMRLEFKYKLMNKCKDRKSGTNEVNMVNTEIAEMVAHVHLDDEDDLVGHGLVFQKTDWIVCVTPSQQQDYVENCLNAAQHAGEAAKVLGYTDEAVRASELVLEEDKVIWSQSVDGVLGLHLLMFTELINESYASFLPHLICGYLFELSKKFCGFYETYESSGIEVSHEGWGVLHDLGPGHVKLLAHHCRDSVKMQNNGCLKICNPSSRHSVPFSSSMRISVLLYATTKDEADFFHVSDDGHIRINYILLRDAVDADIEVKLAGIRDRSVSGEIFAYYKEFDSRDVLVESLYKASLFESFGGSGFKDGSLVLTRSRLAVPTKGSLVIEARLKDFKSGAYILRDFCVFDSDCNGIFKQNIKSKDCTLEVQVTWSRD